jgi:hypothetical protein
MSFKIRSGCFPLSISNLFRKQAQPPVVSGLKPKEAPLAGYLMARAAMHQKIEGPTLKNLRAGHETVQEVNDLLSLGRSNVREDIQKAGETRPDLRNIAVNKLWDAMGVEHWNTHGSIMTYEDAYRMFAATSQYVKTGTCDSFAGNTTTLHASKLAGMKEERAIVTQAHDPEVGHIWSEMIPKGKGPDGKPDLHGEDVIMDGWLKDGLATLREDSAFARLDKDGKADNLEHTHLLDHQSGPGALDQVKKFKRQIERSENLQSVYRNEFNRLVTVGASTDEKYLWDAQSAFHADFRQKAGAALDKDASHPAPDKAGHPQGADPGSIRAKHASLAEIQAMGVARSLGSNIRGAKAEAPGIIASAKEMFSTQKSRSEAAPTSISEGAPPRSKVKGSPSRLSGFPSRLSRITSHLSRITSRLSAFILDKLKNP